MNRRNFPKMSLAATPLVLGANGAELTPSDGERADKGFRGAGEDRHGEELLIMGGKFDLKVSASTGWNWRVLRINYSVGMSARHR
jgi:hypothetical protein